MVRIQPATQGTAGPVRHGFREVDIEKDSAAAAFVAGANGGNQTVPTALLPDGSVLLNPTIDQSIEATAV